MNIGRLRYRVHLQYPNKVEDGMGGRKVKGYETAAIVWADIRTPRIREQLAVGTPATELTTEVVIRRGNKEPQRGWRIKEGKHLYEVIDSKPYDLESLCILTKEIES